MHVIARKSQCRAHHEPVEEHPRELTLRGEVDEVQQDRRGEPEAHYVHQRVEFGTEARIRLAHAGKQTVHQVEDPCDHDPPARQVKLLA